MGIYFPLISSKKRNTYTHTCICQYIQTPHPHPLALTLTLTLTLSHPQTLKRRKNHVVSDECLMKLWKCYYEGRIDIPAFLKAAGLRKIFSTSIKKINSHFSSLFCYLFIYLLKFCSDNKLTVKMATRLLISFLQTNQRK